MTQEAYVSYETAKLLKEKGFDEPCYMSYWLRTKDSIEFVHLEQSGNKYSDCLYAPTHQMACAWLREVHNIFILIGWNPIYKEYFTRIINMTDGCPKRNIHEHAGYEDAVEAALKYAIENLI